jgi:hypothetical protein
MVLNMWCLHHGGSISCDHIVSPMEHKDMLHTTHSHKTTICYRNKDVSPERQVLLPMSYHLFRLAGSKCFQHLRIQPRREYAGFPYAGWWRERGKGKGRNLPFERKRTILLRVAPSTPA